MARTGDSSDDSDSDGDIAVSRWRRPPPSDDECDDAIVLKSHQLRSSQRDSNIVLNIRVMHTQYSYLSNWPHAGFTGYNLIKQKLVNCHVIIYNLI